MYGSRITHGAQTPIHLRLPPVYEVSTRERPSRISRWSSGKQEVSMRGERSA
jgi:hypothetical protein